MATILQQKLLAPCLKCAPLVIPIDPFMVVSQAIQIQPYSDSLLQFLAASRVAQNALLVRGAASG
jgi:hypothetical protein